MVLNKRKRDGEFVPWTPGSQVSASEAGPSDAKKTRTTSQSAMILKETTSTREAPTPTREIIQVTAAIPRAGPTPTTASIISARGKNVTPYGSQETLAPISYATPAPIPRAGPSQLIASGSSPRKRSRGKKAAEDAGGPIEKRAAKYKPKCPQNIRDRLERVRVQRCEHLSFSYQTK